MQEVSKEERQDMSKFEQLVDTIAKLPEKKQENLCFFINGFIAAAETTEEKDKAG